MGSFFGTNVSLCSCSKPVKTVLAAGKHHSFVRTEKLCYGFCFELLKHGLASSSQSGEKRTIRLNILRSVFIDTEFRACACAMFIHSGKYQLAARVVCNFSEAVLLIHIGELCVVAVRDNGNPIHA